MWYVGQNVIRPKDQCRHVCWPTFIWCTSPVRCWATFCCVTNKDRALQTGKKCLPGMEWWSILVKQDNYLLTSLSRLNWCTFIIHHQRSYHLDLLGKRIWLLRAYRTFFRRCLLLVDILLVDSSHQVGLIILLQNYCFRKLYFLNIITQCWGIGLKFSFISYIKRIRWTTWWSQASAMF